MNAILFLIIKVIIYFFVAFFLVFFLEFCDKHLEPIIKRLFCIHKYQPIQFASHLDKDDKKYNTWYVFECAKCHKQKIFKTYGPDKILNAKEIK